MREKTILQTLPVRNCQQNKNLIWITYFWAYTICLMPLTSCPLSLPNAFDFFVLSICFMPSKFMSSQSASCLRHSCPFNLPRGFDVCHLPSIFLSSQSASRLRLFVLSICLTPFTFCPLNLPHAFDFCPLNLSHAFDFLSSQSASRLRLFVLSICLTPSTFCPLNLSHAFDFLSSQSVSRLRLFVLSICLTPSTFCPLNLSHAFDFLSSQSVSRLRLFVLSICLTPSTFCPLNLSHAFDFLSSQSVSRLRLFVLSICLTPSTFVFSIFLRPSTFLFTHCVYPVQINRAMKPQLCLWSPGHAPPPVSTQYHHGLLVFRKSWWEIREDGLLWAPVYSQALDDRSCGDLRKDRWSKGSVSRSLQTGSIQWRWMEIHCGGNAVLIKFEELLTGPAHRPAVRDRFRNKHKLYKKNQPAAQMAARHTISFPWFRNICHESDVTCRNLSKG